MNAEVALPGIDDGNVMIDTTLTGIMVAALIECRIGKKVDQKKCLKGTVAGETLKISKSD